MIVLISISESDCDRIKRLGGCHWMFTGISMNQQVYMATDTLKHWWRGLRKLNILQQGNIHHYRGRVFIPRKCIRSNRGMFFGMIMMNDSNVELSIKADLRFTEIPVNIQ